MTFELIKLPYEEDALAPYISAKTLYYHYEKHHAGYLEKLNKLIKGTPLENKRLEDIILNTEKYPSEQIIFNNAAQVWNHTFYWNSLAPTQQRTNHIPACNFLDMVNRDFGNEGNLKDDLKSTALGQFGSGWVWLVIDFDKLKVIRTPNAVTPLGKYKPLLCIDLWEHAYYLDYQNKRDYYLTAVIDHLINWNFAIENFNDF